MKSTPKQTNKFNNYILNNLNTIFPDSKAKDIFYHGT